MWEIAVVLGFVGIAFILTYLSSLLNDNHIFLKIIFYFSSFFVFILALNFIREIINEATTLKMVNVIFIIVLTITFLTFVYFIIHYIVSFTNLKKEKEREEQGLE